LNRFTASVSPTPTAGRSAWTALAAEFLAELSSLLHRKPLMSRVRAFDDASQTRDSETAPEGLRVLAAVQVQRHPRGGGGIFDIRALEPAAGL
jgi:hypothetical protein